MRSKLANERTFAAWIRTGLAVVAVGIAIARFLPGRAPASQLAFLGLGIGFAFAGVLLFAFAAYDYSRARSEIRDERYNAPNRWLVAIAILVGALSLGVVAALAFGL